MVLGLPQQCSNEPQTGGSSLPLWPWLGGSLGWSAAPNPKGGGFNSPSGPYGGNQLMLLSAKAVRKCPRVGTKSCWFIPSHSWSCLRGWFLLVALGAAPSVPLSWLGCSGDVASSPRLCRCLCTSPFHPCAPVSLLVKPQSLDGGPTLIQGDLISPHYTCRDLTSNHRHRRRC